MIRSVYLPIVSAVQTAGFHVAEMPMTGGDRIVCAARKRESGVYTGNSFWIAERNSEWFLGAWGGWLYRLPSQHAAIQLAVAWLESDSSRTAADVPDHLKDAFGLIEVDDFNTT